MEQTIELHQKDIQSIQDRIEYEKRRIEVKKEEIMYFIHSLNNMNEQIENYSQSMKSILHNNLPLMKAHQSNIIDNSDKLKYNRKKNLLQKARFDKYRKTINAETRLLELEKKIKIVWKRDEIYAGIRDWGFIIGKISYNLFLSFVFLFLFSVHSFFTVFLFHYLEIIIINIKLEEPELSFQSLLQSSLDMIYSM